MELEFFYFSWSCQYESSWLLFSTRYEEAEVRKKLEEKDRQEEEQLQKQKRQEAVREDGGTSNKSSLENVMDSRDKTQKVFEIYSVMLKKTDSFFFRWFA